MNDAHGNDFLRTHFWTEHPDCRLPRGALDFARDEVREYVFRLIEEAVVRYDCDGIELDFNRFPTLFRENQPAAEERVAKIDGLVEREAVLSQGEVQRRALERPPPVEGRAVADRGDREEVGQPEQRRELVDSAGAVQHAQSGSGPE